ncbi:diacylglycerol kinase family protein [Niveispirillum sp.]|uniref:diacylglycerol/lipid kinase family protein n=1 Tax=Niveispirillum sp. TaxID=1917217 RepID=UPI001B413094|nr:diacylglycerol kinase family protein [Niveispirillum sp.]MBP7338344.1 diacylglycerol kinase family lipid kinase [Niveispirillum sp.]
MSHALDRRLAIIFNPVAGRRRPGLVEQVMAAATDAGAVVSLHTTDAAGHATTIARDLARSGTADVIVAAGGDGTINEVVNGMATAGVVEPPPLGVVPLGTANVLAHELGLIGSPERIGRQLALGPPRAVHAGVANGRLFTMMAGTGMDARVVAGIDPVLKRRIGKGAYALGGLREILAGPALDYDVVLTAPDGGISRHKAVSCILCKGHYYAGTFVLAPDVRLEQPVLHAVLFTRAGRLAALTYATAMTLGLLAGRSDVRVLPAVSARIEGPVGEPVQGDGDIIARLPVDIGLWSGRLRVVGM